MARQMKSFDFKITTDVQTNLSDYKPDEPEWKNKKDRDYKTFQHLWKLMETPYILTLFAESSNKEQVWFGATSKLQDRSGMQEANDAS